LEREYDRTAKDNSEKGVW